jgi:hypothetical protein
MKGDEEVGPLGGVQDILKAYHKSWKQNREGEMSSC